MKSKLDDINLLQKYCCEANTLADILYKFELSMTTKNYVRLKNRINIHNIDISHFNRELTFPEKWKRDNIEPLVRDSFCYTEVLRAMNLSIQGSNSATLKKYISFYNIDTSHFIKNYKKDTKRNNWSVSNDIMFIENSVVDRNTIKKRIIREKLIPYLCNKCNNTGEWQEDRLTLQLEHKNGISNDNRLENLIFLCPNCHSQTSTFAGRNSKKG